MRTGSRPWQSWGGTLRTWGTRVGARVRGLPWRSLGGTVRTWGTRVGARVRGLKWRSLGGTLRTWRTRVGDGFGGRPLWFWCVLLVVALVVVGLGVRALTTSDENSAPVASPGSTSGPEQVVTPVMPPTRTDAPTEPVPETTSSSVPLDETASFGTGVTARLTAVESVAGEASGPGEVAGPAIRLTVELHNGTEEALELSTVVVDVFAGAELAPGEPLTGSGAQWFEGSLEPGGDATGVYVFSVPEDLRDQVSVRVSYDPLVPTALFEGPVTPT
jgi:hypothetical protein